MSNDIVYTALVFLAGFVALGWKGFCINEDAKHLNSMRKTMETFEARLKEESVSIRRDRDQIGRILDKLFDVGVEVPPLVASEVQPVRGTAHGGDAASSDKYTREAAE